MPGAYIEGNKTVFICPSDVEYYPPPPSGKGYGLSYEYNALQLLVTPAGASRPIGKTYQEVLRSHRGNPRASATVIILFDFDTFHFGGSIFSLPEDFGGFTHTTGSKRGILFLDAHADCL